MDYILLLILSTLVLSQAFSHENTTINPTKLYTLENSGDMSKNEKMSEGNLIRTLFNIGITMMNDLANEAKFLEDLKKNGTNLNETASNATRQWYERRYYSRYGCGFGGCIGRYNTFRGVNLRTALLLADMQSISTRITKREGFGNTFGGYHGYGLHSFGSRPIQPQIVRPPKNNVGWNIPSRSGKGTGWKFRGFRGSLRIGRRRG